MMRATLLALLFCAQAGWAQEVRIAVASNFLATAEELAEAYAGEGGAVEIVHGSTGRLYAQIKAGAPFDVFLAADVERPGRLLAEGDASRVVPYAFGRLVLVGARDGAGSLAARLGAADRIALADPDVAPYGRAALEALEALGVEGWRDRAVFGENVGQTFAFVATGNAPVGLVALSQAMAADIGWLEVSPGLHAPIRQDAALISDDPAAAAFFDWLRTEPARAIIAGAGYGLPE